MLVRRVGEGPVDEAGEVDLGFVVVTVVFQDLCSFSLSVNFLGMLGNQERRGEKLTRNGGWV